MSRIFQFFAIALLLTTPALATLQQSDFDVVAFKWNTGETVADTPLGVFASPAPVLDAAVNLMVRDDVIPFYLTEGPTGNGVVLFGLIDENMWTPTDGDGIDLSTEFDSAGNRVYASLAEGGNMELRLARDFFPHVVLDSATVTVDPDTPFFFLQTGLGWVVYYGDEVVLEAFLPEEGFGVDPATIGNDFCISVLSGPTETGTATINDLARNASLEVAGYPRVLYLHGPPGVDQFHPMGFDVIPHGEVTQLAIPIQNVGSSTAAGLTARLIPSPGSGLVVTGSDTASYGSLEPDVGATRIFGLDASVAVVGSHELTLEITGGLTDTLVTSVTVWGNDVTILDLESGEITFDLDTVFAAHSAQVTVPETIDDPALPYRFDLQFLDQTVTHTEPFYGTHWGDGYAEDPIFINSRPVEGMNDVNLTINVKFRNGAAMEDAHVQVWSDGQPVGNGFVGANGSVSLSNLPDGLLKIYVWPPKHLRDVYKNPKSLSHFFEPGSYSVKFTFANLPNGYAPQPPPNAQGQNGGQGAGRRVNTGRKLNAGRSIASAVGTFIGTAAIDAASLLGGPAAPVLAWYLSGTGAATLATITSAASDPIDQDVFYFGQEQTPPNNPDELTLQERVVMTVVQEVAQGWLEPVSITTTYTYTRTTDQETYTYTGGETLVHERYLPISLTVETPAPGQLVVRAEVQTPDLSPLPGPEALVQASVYDSTGDLIEQLLLNDDGQGDDDSALDGTYSGRASGAGVDNMTSVLVVATWSGFDQQTVPPWVGFARFSEREIFADGFDDGDTAQWSSTSN